MYGTPQARQIPDQPGEFTEPRSLLETPREQKELPFLISSANAILPDTGAEDRTFHWLPFTRSLCWRFSPTRGDHLTLF